MVRVTALLLLVMIQACTTITITNSLLVNTTLTQDRPVRAGISTTGEDIGEALKAAGFGNPVSIEDLKDIVAEYRRIKSELGK